MAVGDVPAWLVASGWGLFVSLGLIAGAAAGLYAPAKQAMGVEQIHVVADRGYFSGKEVLARESVGAIPYVPKPYTSESKAAGRFAKDNFTFNATDNTYRCPAGESLTYRFTSVEHDLKLDVYWTTKCSECPIRSRCTTGDIRRIKRWEKEDVVDAMLKRLEDAPDSMNVRRRTVEHPFRTLKSWMGTTHFLTKASTASQPR